MRKLTYEEMSKTRIQPHQINSAARLPVSVLVDNVRSLYNVGSIFRTSDGAMISELILTGFTPTPPRREIEKTALGATKSVPWRYVEDPLLALRSLKEQRVTICCLEQTDGSIPYHSVLQSHFPICLVIGNEVTGIGKEILAYADLAIQIPMYGIKHSLNVAVAYGIAVFELHRIWKNATGYSSNDSV